MSEEDQNNPPQPQHSPAQFEKEEVEKSLIDKALDDVRMLFRGNGVKPDLIQLKSFEGEVFNFEALEVFKLETSVGEKHVNGREHGEIAGSYTDAQQRIKAAVERLSRDREVKTMTKTILKRRKDMGFGLDHFPIRFEKLSKKFVTHEQCGPCDASGKILCQNCQGKGQEACHRCHGQRLVNCTMCHGTQFVNTPNGRKQCTRCQGRGKVQCDMCHQTGMIACQKCASSGKVACHSCSGTGWHSRVFIMKVIAKSLFDFDREAMPEEVAELVDDMRDELVIDDHVQARIIEEPKKDEELDRISKIDEFIVPYHVKLPWGDIEFAIRGKLLKAKLFGYNPLLLELPPILDDVLKGGLTSLEAASSGTGSVAKHIGKAIRYRTIGEAFMASIPHPAKKAQALMAERYPYGISEQTLERMVIHAQAAMGHLTRKPRIIGLAFGAAITAAFYAAYFAGPLRAMILEQAAQKFPDLIPDLGVLIVGCSILTGAIQYSSGQALRSALGRLSTKSNIKAKSGESMLWGIPAAFSLLAIFVFLAASNDLASIEWLEMIKGGK